MIAAAASRVLFARGLRAFGDGYVSLLLPLYLLELGYAPLEVGVIATTTLVGSGVVTLGVGLYAHRFHYRVLLFAACALLAFTGIAFASVASFWPLLVIAFVGTLNPSSGDVSLFLPLEHAVLSRVVSDKERTAAFARYSLVGSVGAAVGALAIGLPPWIEQAAGLSRLASMQAMFVLYAIASVPMALVYRTLPRNLEGAARRAPAPLTRSKGRVYTLAALFCVDAFAGGFVVQSLLALWLFQRHDVSPTQAGVIFFWTGVLSAISYLVAVRIAKRIGLVNTMVFTHIPSSLALIALPFAQGMPAVLALLFIRAALSQMDVPTRSSYVMAIVLPEERPAAASITAVPRSLASAAGPLAAGYLLGLSPFGWPLVIAGGLKIAYDLALLAAFGKIRPPEESVQNGATIHPGKADHVRSTVP
jgi:MFS family permease